jgi:hypothetical protein
MKSYGVQNEVKAYCNRIQNETSVIVTPSLVKTLNDRVESLKKSGVWSQYGLGFNDRDADSYFQRASINNLLGRFEVCLFVRGMKTLGLWQNMVCWPLRSSQNAATGDIMYSLGGLGTFNGTMVNTPVRGADGMEFTNSGSTHITITVPATLPTTWMTAVNFASQVFRSVFSHDNGSSFVPSVGLAPESSGNTWYFQTVNSAPTVTSGTRSAALGAMRWASFSVRQNPETSLLRVDDSTTTMTASASMPSLSRLYLGRRSDGLYANMTMPFFAVVNSYQDSAAIREIYRTTLGQGLGLP